MEEDKSLFLQEMQGVIKHTPNNKVDLKASKKIEATQNQQVRRELAQTGQLKDDNHLVMQPLVMVDPEEILSFKRDGVGNQVFRKFRLGQYPIEAKLDLHRMKVVQARKEVFDFVQNCIKFNIRGALISHGKASHSEVKAMLKSCVNAWLPELNDVLAFHSAQQKHGGSGSVYIMLRKSDQQKLENKLHHSKGRE
ncbi:MAG: DNA endonuclease SmrA [Saccharospirillaceae bacterium]|nr:DNA endonuclease SmrA [Pseudomonadales bacterium]NRB81034.1 DNA endonuclease SmrA [Saccharospirillaceae bacterium]